MSDIEMLRRRALFNIEKALDFSRGCIELSEKYCNVANERIRKELSQSKLNLEVKQEAMQSQARHSSQA